MLKSSSLTLTIVSIILVALTSFCSCSKTEPVVEDAKQEAVVKDQTTSEQQPIPQEEAKPAQENQNAQTPNLEAKPEDKPQDASGGQQDSSKAPEKAVDTADIPPQQPEAEKHPEAKKEEKPANS